MHTQNTERRTERPGQFTEQVRIITSVRSNELLQPWTFGTLEECRATERQFNILDMGLDDDVRLVEEA